MEFLSASFNQSAPGVLLLAAIDGNSKIVAHAICYIQSYEGFGNVGFILQLEKDKGLKESRIIPAGLAIIKEWCQRLGLKDVFTMTMDRKLVRAFQRWGFREFRIITRFDVTENKQETIQAREKLNM